MTSEEILASKTEAELLTALKRAEDKIAYINAVSEITDDEHNSIGHPGHDQCLSRSGQIYIETLRANILRPYELGRSMVLREIERRKSLSPHNHPVHGEN